ncbi:hypothetical protein SDC9_178320 [bioreactor metagenome]|uniref:Uncharacterized protein n=1 Tax=bioreactor metagenome TaxID=1076179 RepID=A0A645GYN7_9ZZZZ
MRNAVIAGGDAQLLIGPVPALALYLGFGNEIHGNALTQGIFNLARQLELQIGREKHPLVGTRDLHGADVRRHGIGPGHHEKQGQGQHQRSCTGRRPQGPRYSVSAIFPAERKKSRRGHPGDCLPLNRVWQLCRELNDPEQASWPP